MVPVLNNVSSLSTADGLAIHEVFRVRVCGALLTGSEGGTTSDSLSITGFKLPAAAAAAERATTPADSLVNVMSLSPNTARGQVLGGASGPEATESVASVEVDVLPLLLLLLPLLLLPGEVELE